MIGFGQANFLQALGWAVLNSLWQMAFLWVLYQGLTALFKSSRSTIKSALASSLLITGFVWFAYTFISIFTSHTTDDAVISSGLVNAAGNRQLNNWLHETLPLASLVYLVLLILPLMHFMRNYRYVQVIRSYGLSKASVEWRVFVKKVAAQMGIRKPVHIWISEMVSSPVTIGYLKPVILVPLAAINHLSPQQLEAVLLHELSHIKRYDYLVNLIINFIQSILYFNPFVKALVKIVEREREKSCDEMVIQYQYDSFDYASALLILEKNGHLAKPLTVAAAGKKNDLLHRVELILGVPRKRGISFNKIAGLFAGLLCVIALNALLIMSRPASHTQMEGFAKISNPFYFFTHDNNHNAAKAAAGLTGAAIVERPSPTVINRITKKEMTPRATAHREIEPPPPIAATPVPAKGLINAFYEPVITLQLKKYQEQQVKLALTESKKVLENVQWKVVENNIADVFTQNEKSELHDAYQKELEKFDWKKWENKLRGAYDQVDWERVNMQLGSAVTQMKLDSLQHVYTNAALQIEAVQLALNANNMKGIPDSDITLKNLDQQKQELDKALSNLKALRSRKIVHL